MERYRLPVKITIFTVQWTVRIKTREYLLSIITKMNTVFIRDSDRRVTLLVYKNLEVCVEVN